MDGSMVEQFSQPDSPLHQEQRKAQTSMCSMTILTVANWQETSALLESQIPPKLISASSGTKRELELGPKTLRDWEFHS